MARCRVSFRPRAPRPPRGFKVLLAKFWALIRAFPPFWYTLYTERIRYPLRRANSGGLIAPEDITERHRAMGMRFGEYMRVSASGTIAPGVITGVDLSGGRDSAVMTLADGSRIDLHNVQWRFDAGRSPVLDDLDQQIQQISETVTDGAQWAQEITEDVAAGLASNYSSADWHQSRPGRDVVFIERSDGQRLSVPPFNMDSIDRNYLVDVCAAMLDEPLATRFDLLVAERSSRGCPELQMACEHASRVVQTVPDRRMVFEWERDIRSLCMRIRITCAAGEVRAKQVEQKQESAPHKEAPARGRRIRMQRNESK